MLVGGKRKGQVKKYLSSVINLIYEHYYVRHSTFFLCMYIITSIEFVGRCLASKVFILIAGCQRGMGDHRVGQ
jgi:hypothetical protein